MNILLFGELAELVGGSTISVEEVKDSEMLKQVIGEQYPVLQAKSFLIAIDKKVITGKMEIVGNAEIALLPPFSGG